MLRARHGPRVATFATATFVTNTIAEMYVMQRYLQPDDLTRAGVGAFDAWAPERPLSRSRLAALEPWSGYAGWWPQSAPSP
ncbi:MAG: hypothetical protein ACYC1D_05860 [Acidimicrobiales bacterium]